MKHPEKSPETVRRDVAKQNRQAASSFPSLADTLAQMDMFFQPIPKSKEQ